MLFLVVLGLLATPSLGFRLPYIVNGEDAEEGQFPWQASYKVLPVPTLGHICGASLISSQWLVTAAHCIYGDIVSHSIALGQLKISDETFGNIYLIAQAIRHPDYIPIVDSWPNDIGLIQLSREVVFNENIQPVVMADGNHSFAGETCQMSGWGRTSGGGPYPDVLQFADTVVLSNAECIQRHPDINDGHVCIGGVGPQGPGGCQADSGGPLTCTQNNSPVLVGAMSWGPRDCSTSAPSVYSRISYFRDWIREEAGV